MAAILNSGGSGTAGATVLPAPTASAAPGTAAQGAAPSGADEATDAFTQLIASMIAGNGTSSDQSAGPSLQDLAAIGLGADGGELSGDDRDVEGDEATDGEAGALAMAALLPGLSSLAPPAPGNLATDAAGAIDTALLAKRADVDVSQTALSELSGEATDAGGSPASSESTKGASSGAQSTTPSTQMHALMAAHAAARDIDVTPDGTLSSPVGTSAWKDELGTHLTWMAANGLESASLRLSPEHLGPLDIRISVREGEASVYFGATNPDTRSALEQSLPRLRELFASQGLVLTDAGVSRDAPRNAFKPSAQPAGPRSVSDAAGDATVKSVTLARLGLIDTYV